jgi:hypothetical protein
MTPAALLAEARRLLHRATPETRGRWPRAAALLARQALETAVAEHGRARNLPLADCSARAQFLYLRETGHPHQRDLTARAYHAWTALSRACHHHAYELAPTAAELEGWMGVVGEWVESHQVLR